MTDHFVDPWAYALEGPWREEMMRAARPCHYGCGKLAVMTEPGKTGKAHKACALGTQSTGPLGYGDVEDHDHPEARVLGCGTPADGQTSGRACAGTGGELSCQLCPNSPPDGAHPYWRGAP